MTLFSTLKRNSKLALKDNWGRAIFVLLIHLGVSALLSALLWVATNTFLQPVFQNPTMEPAGLPLFELFTAYQRRLILLCVFTLLGCLVLAPLQLGRLYWFRWLVHGKSLPLNEMFRFFESFRAFRRAVWYYLNLHARALVWGLAFYAIPCGVMVASVFTLQGGGERSTLMLATVGLTFSVALLLLASILFLAFLNRYILVAYLLCEDEELRVCQAIRTSIRYTRGYRFSFLLYGLTFLGWLLVSALTLGLGAIYTAPYLNTAYAMYSRYIIEKNRYIPPNATQEFIVEAAPGQRAEPPEDTAGA